MELSADSAQYFRSIKYVCSDNTHHHLNPSQTSALMQVNNLPIMFFFSLLILPFILDTAALLKEALWKKKYLH